MFGELAHYVSKPFNLFIDGSNTYPIRIINLVQHTSTFPYLCMLTHTHTHAHTCIHTHTHTCTPTHTGTYTHAKANTRTGWVWTCACMCVCPLGYQIYNLYNFEWVVLDPSIHFLHYLGMVFQSDASYLVAAATKTGFSTFTDQSFLLEKYLNNAFLV